MNDTPSSSHGRRRAIPALFAVIFALAGAIGTWFLSRPSARTLFEQALAASQSDAAAGERLLRRAVRAADGRYPDAQIALCHLLARQGHWDEALSLLHDVETTACRADLLLAFGRDAIQTEHRLEGLQALHAVARRGTPASVAALELLVQDYYDWGQQNEQAAAARELAQLDPDNPQQWLKLVTILNSMNRVNDEVAALREAIQQNPPQAYRQEFQHMLANAMLEQGKIDDAWREFAEWIRLEGGSFRVNIFEIRLRRMRGESEQALKLIGALSPAPGDMPTLYLVRGTVYLDLRRYDEAARDLQMAVADRPNDAQAHSKLSAAYRGLRRDDDAALQAKISSEIPAKRLRVKMLLKQRTNGPPSGLLYQQLADAYRELGEGENADRWQQRAARLSPSEVRSH